MSWSLAPLFSRARSSRPRRVVRGSDIFHPPGDQVARNNVQQVNQVGVAFGVETAEVKAFQSDLDDVLAREGARDNGKAEIGSEVLFLGVLESLTRTPRTIVPTTYHHACIKKSLQ